MLKKYFNNLIMIALLIIIAACKKDVDIPIVPVEPPVKEEWNENDLLSPEAFVEYGNVNIKTIANGNSWEAFLAKYIKDISGENYGYCHPDVEYFPDGFHGYKFWMAFTPYFGSIGSSGDAILYENPSIVVSNDGLNWIEPRSQINPLQLRPSFKEGVVRNGTDTLQAYWSDTDLIFRDNRLEIFYRGNYVSLKSLERITSKSSNNLQKLSKFATRSIVKQVSKNGVDWDSVEILYTSNNPETLHNNDVLSPSFIVQGEQMKSYEVLFNTGQEGYRENDKSFVLKRISSNGLDFSNFENSKIIRFNNKPWLKTSSNYSPWHVQASYIDGVYYLMLAVGKVNSYTSDALYIAYSKDGDNFNVFPKPLVNSDVYRSCLFPLNVDQQIIELGAVIGFKSGQFKYRKFKLNKSILSKVVG